MDSATIQRQLLTAILPHIPFDGWSARSLEMARNDANISELDAFRAFPNGAADAVEYFMCHLDSAMQAALAELPLDEMKVHEKIHAAIMLRLKAAEPHREAVRKALAYYSVPLHADKSLKRLYDTTDCIWRSIGDHPTDFSFYTKRFSLAMIYSATLLFWLDDHSEDNSETAEFLSRRLQDLFKFHKLKKRVQDNPITRRFASQ